MKLVDLGLIYYYLLRGEDIKSIEDTTFYTVKILKDLSNYKIRIIYNKIIFYNESEKLIFNKVNTSKELKWALDEF